MDYKSTVHYHTVFEVSFAESIDVRIPLRQSRPSRYDAHHLSLLFLKPYVPIPLDCLEERRPVVGHRRRGLFHRVAVHQEHYSIVDLVLAHDGTHPDTDIAVAAPSRQICSRRCLCKHKNKLLLLQLYSCANTGTHI
jgi:hypothetical protein